MTQSLAGLHFGARSALGTDFWLWSQPPWLLRHPSVPLSPLFTDSRTHGSPPCWGPVPSSWDCLRTAESGLRAALPGSPSVLVVRQWRCPMSSTQEPGAAAPARAPGWQSPCHAMGRLTDEAAAGAVSVLLLHSLQTPDLPELLKHLSGKPTQPLQAPLREPVFLQLLYPEPQMVSLRRNACSQSSGARSMSSGCPRAMLPSEAPGEGPACLVQLVGLQASLGLWYVTPVSASVFRWPLPMCLFSSVSLTRTFVTGFRATWIIQDDLLISKSLT